MTPRDVISAYTDGTLPWPETVRRLAEYPYRRPAHLATVDDPLADPNSAEFVDAIDEAYDARSDPETWSGSVDAAWAAGMLTDDQHDQVAKAYERHSAVANRVGG